MAPPRRLRDSDGRLTCGGGGLVASGWCLPAAPFPSSNFMLFGRVMASTREAGGTVAKSLVGRCSRASAPWHALAGNRRRARGVRTLMRENQRRNGRKVSKGKADLWPRSASFLREPTRSGERARSLRRFSRMSRALDGWMFAHAPASPAQGLRRHEPRYIFLISAGRGHERRGLV